MKKIYTILIFSCINTVMFSQSFEFSLSFIGTNDVSGNYEVALLAIPDFTEANGNSADLGTVISLSDNVFIQTAGFVNDCVNSGPPLFETTCEYPIEKEEWTANYLTGPSDASPGRFIYSLERTETGESTFFDAVSGVPITLAVFQIYPVSGGNPTTGDVTLVNNGDAILNGTPNESYFNINYATATSNSTADLFGGQSAIGNTVNFSTLTVQENEFIEIEVSVYPNPAVNTLNINSVIPIKKIDFYNILGKQVFTTSKTENISISELQSGIYLLKIYSESSTIVKRIVKN